MILNSQTIINLSSLTKRYPGSPTDAINDVSLTIKKGSIFGFLGPNGAGKTTTISVLVGLIHPTHGEIKIFGRDNEQFGLENRAHIGYPSGDMALDKSLTGWQELEYLGHLRGAFDKARVEELARRLNCGLTKKIKNLSRGNHQKIGLIAALMHQPELLILDEPTSGLDPLIQAEFNQIILDRQKQGKTTFMSSHVLSEVQELCDELAIIREGKIIMQTSLQDLLSKAPRAVRLTSDGSYHPEELVHNLRGVSSLMRHDHSISFGFTGDVNELLRRIAKRPLTNVVIQHAELEDIFMGYYSGKEESRAA